MFVGKKRFVEKKTVKKEFVGEIISLKNRKKIQRKKPKKEPGSRKLIALAQRDSYAKIRLATRFHCYNIKQLQNFLNNRMLCCCFLTTTSLVAIHRNIPHSD